MENTLISPNNFHQHWYACPITLPVRRNPQQRSLWIGVSTTSAPGRASSVTFERPFYEPLYATNTFHRKQETFPYKYPLH
jgi:hypothetical protein